MRLLFDHLPKCGGTSAREYLSRNFQKRFALYSQRHFGQLRTMKQPERYQFDLVYGHGAFSIRHLVHPDMKLFTIMRHPVSRLLSLYHHIKRNPEHWHHAVARRLPIEEFYVHPKTRHLNNWYVQHFGELTAQKVGERPEWAYRVARESVFRSFFLVGFQETLGESLRRLALPLPVHLTMANQGKYERPSKKVLTHLSIRNQMDIKLFEAMKKEYK